MIQRRRHEYLLSFLPSLEPIGSIPPMSKSDLLAQVVESKGPVRTIEILFLSDDLTQYQALLAEEMGATHEPLPYADAKAVSSVVRAHVEAAPALQAAV